MATLTATIVIDPEKLDKVESTIAALRAALAAARADADELAAKVNELTQLVYRYSVADNVPFLVRNAADRASRTTDAHTAAILAGWLACLPPHRFDESPDRPEPPRQADAALWRERTLSTREILNLVEDLSDDPSPANVQALVDAFEAWRMCVERGVPAACTLAGEGEAGAENGGVTW